MFGQRHRLSGRSRSASWLAVAMASLCVGVSVTSAGTIQWRSGAVDIRALSPVEIASEVAALAAQRGGDARRVIVQLDGPLGAGLREELSADGLRLLEYLGENSFFAALDADADAVGLGQVSALVGIEAVRSEWKMHPLLASSDSTPWAQVGHDERGVVVVATYVMFHRDVDLVSDGMAAVERYGADVRGILESINGLVVEVSEDLIPLLAAEDAVLWIEPALPPMKPVNDCGRSRTGADTVQAPPYGLDGAGVTVLVYDGAQRAQRT